VPSRTYRSLSATLLGLAVILVTAAGASAAPSPVVGHVYVNDNTAPANSIAAFGRHSDGTLTPVDGSPFPAGGAGTGTPAGSQGALQTSARGHYLLAVDAGSNQVSVLRIHRDGRLTLVDLVSSEGVKPVSIAVHGDLVYVANAGAGGQDYTGFRLSAGGDLDAIPGSTFRLPDGSLPGDVLFNSTGTNLVGTRVGPGLIDSFAVGPDGLLTPAAGSPFPAQGPGPFGSEFSPVAPDQLFVSNAHGGPGNGTVSAFAVSPSGVLQSIGDSPFADHQTAPCWVEITRDGRYLFTVNTASNSVSSYTIAPHGRWSTTAATRSARWPSMAAICTSWPARRPPSRSAPVRSGSSSTRSPRGREGSAPGPAASHVTPRGPAGHCWMGTWLIESDRRRSRPARLPIRAIGDPGRVGT
jgi:6-phosphogluconolactonase